MKNLNSVYVIVMGYNNEFNYFQDFVSFDKNELQPVCDKLNDEFHDKTKKQGFPKLTPPYNILTLKETIVIFRENLADANMTHDESY